MTKEQKFYKALQDVFIGAKIEGKGGFVNLMKIKSKYYRKIEELLKADVEKALEKYLSFRDELFDKLYYFFNRYFTESGSIYFNSTPFHNNIYEKVCDIIPYSCIKSKVTARTNMRKRLCLRHLIRFSYHHIVFSIGFNFLLKHLYSA